MALVDGFEYGIYISRPPTPTLPLEGGGEGRG